MTNTHTDYDNNEFFNALAVELADEGFEDTSYGNDTCPSLGLEFDHAGQEGFIQIFIEYVNPDLREYPLEDSEDCVIINFSIDGDFIHSMALTHFNIEDTLALVEKMRKYVLEQILTVE